MIFANLMFKRITIHEVFQRNDDKTPVPPSHGNSLIALGQKATEALRSRVITAMGKASQSVEMEIRQSGQGSMLALVQDLMKVKDDQQYIATSTRAADQLTAAQLYRKLPGGILVVFEGEIDHPAKRVIGVIKAEPQNGFTRTNNAGVLGLEFLEDLILTPQAKLYKIGVFVEVDAAKASGANPAEGFRAFIYDDGMTSSNRDAAAQYFYEGFLGCGFPQSSARLTKQFHSLTKEFIGNLGIPEELKLDLGTGLYTYLKVDQGTTVQVAQFAQAYLVDDHMRDAYEQFMKVRDFPDIAVAKDLTEVAPHLKLRKVRFKSEIRLSGPADKFNELVEMKLIAAAPLDGSPSNGEKWTQITIRDRIVSQE